MPYPALRNIKSTTFTKYGVTILLLFTCFFATAQASITSFNPVSGPPGTIVTITGNNFSTAAINNIVYFGAAKAVVNSASANSLNVTVPAGATYDYIEVMTNGFSAYSIRPFIVVSGSPLTPASFSSRTDFQTTALYPTFIVRKDLDMDGRPDMAEANFSSSNISVFRNTSVSGTVSFATVINYNTHIDPEGLAAEDVNGDGKPDLIVTSIDDHLFSVFVNTSTVGNISFAARQDFPENPLFWPRGIVTCDVDGDGLPDLAIPENNKIIDFATNTSHGSFSIYRNTGLAGNVSFAPAVSYNTGDYPRRVVMGDLDGDNKPDFAVSNFISNTISVFKNNSTPGNINLTLQQTIPIPGQSEGLQIGDIDGDGNLELLASNLSGTPSITIFRNISTAGFINFAPVEYVPIAGATGFSIGDIDGDAKPDLAVSSFFTGSVAVFKNISSNGIIGFAPKIEYPAGASLLDTKIGDVDGDGFPDLTVSNDADNIITVLRMGGANPVLELGNDATFCEGDSLVLRADINNAQYLWNTGSTSNTITVKQSGTYWARVTTPSAVLSDTIRITVNPQPQVDLGEDLTLCKGNSTTLDAFNTGATYSWNNGSTQSSIPVTQGGTYSVTVDLAGCIQKDTVMIVYDSLPSFTFGPDAVLCEGTSLLLDPKLSSNVNYSWQDGSTGHTLNVTSEGTYFLTISNDCGSFTDDILVQSGLCQLFMPNAFTPNHDGKNDRFGIKYPGFIRKVDMKIFNRWGTLVYQSTDPGATWDGTYKGQLQPSDNYIWTIYLTDQSGKSSFYKGNVVLIR